MQTFAEIADLIEAEGYSGPHTLIFLIRYAHLSGDKARMDRIVASMESMDHVKESPMLLKAFKELYKATGHGKEIVDFLSSREANQPKGDMPWDLIDRYKENFDPKDLEQAIAGGKFIQEHFHEMFRPGEVYDLEEPSFNSQVAVLYDELARHTQDKNWLDARAQQNRMIRFLADKYPTQVTYGLIALLPEEFGETTVVCEGAVPEAVKNFYAPTTAILYIPSGEQKIGIMKDGVVQPVEVK